MVSRFQGLAGITLLACAFLHYARARGNEHMKVILLGTGTPFPNAERLGAAILVEADAQKLLFDCGRGVVIRLAEAGVKPSTVDFLFLTHLHSDHVVGIPDLWLTGWFLGRQGTLEIRGPTGTRSLATHLKQAFSADVAGREASPEDLPGSGAEIEAEDIGQGVIYDHSGVRVTAFLVNHLNMKPAVGYRVDYQRRSVVISGDTRFSENLIHFAKGADCLLHVAWLPDNRNSTPESMRSLASAEDAGRVFAAVKPKLAVVYHYKSEQGLAEAVRSEYKGPLVIARDLMVIDVGEKVVARP